MAEKVVSVRLQARVEGFTSGMAKAKASVDDLTKAAAPSKADAFGKLADKAAVAGLGVATAVGVAVKRFADFDQAMSAVQANSGATGESLDALRQAAVTMGADSQFSAKEAADGINEMAKAGVATSDILGGGLKGALDLAAAGQIGVAEAAETAATAMTQFGLEGSKVPHIADLLANAANKAQGGVGDMAQALKQTGLVAASMGLSIEETTAGLTAFASAGLLGSDAGTSFKTMLQRLSAPVGEAKTLMDELNINAYDTSGNFVGLANVAEQLKTSMEKMTPAQRAAAMSVIFGSDAVRAANVLYEQGGAGIDKWTEAVSEQGAAAKQAAALTDNLKGDVERLGGALDSVFINTGSGANGSLRSLTQGVTGLVEKIGEVPGPILLAGGALTSFALLAPKGVLAYRGYMAQLDSLGLSMDKISTKAPKTGKALNAAATAAKGLAVAATAVAVLGRDMDKLGTERLQAGLLKSADAADELDKSINGLNKSGFGNGATNVRDFGDVLRYSFDPGFMDQTAHSLEGVLGVFGVDQTNDISIAGDRLQEIDTTLTQMVQSGAGDQAASLFGNLTEQAQAQGISVDQLKAKFPAYQEALAGVSNAAVTTATDQSKLTGATDDLEQSADDAKKALDSLRDAIEGLGSPLAAQRAAERDFQDSIDAIADSLKSQRDELIKNREAEIAGGQASKSATDAVTKARLSLAQAQEKLNSLDGKATTAQKLSAQQRVEKATLSLKQAQDRANESTGKARELTDAERTAIEKWADAKLKQTDLLNVDTEAGRANQAALDEIRASTLANVAATFEATGSTEQATAAMQRGRDAFIKAAEAAGVAAPEAKKLADNLGLVPKNVSILVEQSGAEQAGAEIDQAARDRTAVITVKRRIADERDRRQDAANSDPVRKAQGGAIYGAGTGTSDSIHALLSNGEHVWTAAEVSRLGGQGAMYALRAAVRAGNLPRYATGGAVGSRFAPSRLMGYSTSTTTHTENHNAPIYVDKFMGTTVQDLEVEAERRRRLQNASAY